MFDHVGPKAPFNLVGILDLVYVVLFLVFICCIGGFDKGIAADSE